MRFVFFKAHFSFFQCKSNLNLRDCKINIICNILLEKKSVKKYKNKYRNILNSYHTDKLVSDSLLEFLYF